jgi:hypothetical protein
MVLDAPAMLQNERGPASMEAVHTNRCGPRMLTACSPALPCVALVVLPVVRQYLHEQRPEGHRDAAGADLHLSIGAAAVAVTVAGGGAGGAPVGVKLADWHEYALEDAARDDDAGITTALVQQGGHGHPPLGLETVLHTHPGQAELAPPRRAGGPIVPTDWSAQ